jgi:hypothetical protein
MPTRTTPSAPEDDVTVSLRKVLTWLVVGLVVLYLVNFPEQAAGLVSTAARGLVAAGSALVSFVTSLG